MGKTEEECLKTAKYLQQFGTFNSEKLHVRVKAIHDKNKADTSPQMQQSPKSKIPTKVVPPPPLPMNVPPQSYFGDPYYQQNASSLYNNNNGTKRGRSKNTKRSKD